MSTARYRQNAARLIVGIALAVLMSRGAAAEESPVRPTPTQMTFPEPPVWFNETVIEQIRTISLDGRRMGNRLDVFSKVGDSITVSNAFLQPFGYGMYQIGGHTAIEPIIAYFSATNARDGNSFINPSLAAGVGWTAFGALDPQRANQEVCAAGELPLLCEYRLVRPSIALIMFGTNDVGWADLLDYQHNLTRIVQYSIRLGVIPIVSTIPNRPGLEARVERFNAVVHEIAETYSIPLWDYYAATVDLPNYGLAEDDVHPSSPPRDVATTTNLRPPYLQYGYNVRNLTALQMLYSVWWHLQQAEYEETGSG